MPEQVGTVACRCGNRQHAGGAPPRGCRMPRFCACIGQTSPYRLLGCLCAWHHDAAPGARTRRCGSADGGGVAVCAGGHCRCRQCICAILAAGCASSCSPCRRIPLDRRWRCMQPTEPARAWMRGVQICRSCGAHTTGGVERNRPVVQRRRESRCSASGSDPQCLYLWLLARRDSCPACRMHVLIDAGFPRCTPPLAHTDQPRSTRWQS